MKQCEFCDRELSLQSEYDACNTCIELMKTLINDPPVRTIRLEDDWHTCARCGADKGNLDLWQAYCDRCAELAELEREIGRATLGRTIWDSMMWRLPVEVVGYMSGIGALTDAQLDALIARWRQLHAGAEGEQTQ